MNMSIKKILKIVGQIGKNWLNENSFTQSAAAAYYAIFSLPGIIIVTSIMASFFYEKSMVDKEINSMIADLIGQELSLNLQSAMDSLTFTKNSWIALLIGMATILFGATRFFLQLQRSLNFIWDIEIKKSSTFWRVIKKRFTSLALVLFVGFMLLVTLSVTSFLALLSDYIAIQLPYLNIDTMILINNAVMFGIVTLLFTLIFKTVPDALILWSSSIIGAIVSASLFTIGQSLIIYFFSVTDPQSAFGAAGSIILMMLWVSYAFMILLLGAHVTKAHMEYVTGKKVKADSEIAKKSINQSSSKKA